jgi:hypothetical protein
MKTVAQSPAPRATCGTHLRRELAGATACVSRTASPSRTCAKARFIAEATYEHRRTVAAAPRVRAGIMHLARLLERGPVVRRSVNIDGSYNVFEAARA